jgi:hypothetical protein
MPDPSNERPTTGPGGAATPAKKRYRSPTLETYGTFRDLTLTNAAGPNFDGGGGANIYAS